MKELQKKNLLIVYQDSNRKTDLSLLNDSFQVVSVTNVKRINLSDFRKKGNLVVAAYNDVLFENEADNVFFICASELNNNVVGALSKFTLNEDDYSIFLENKTGNLPEYLSGLAVKKDVLIRIGCLDKYTFYNLFLNFLINYARFRGTVTADTFSDINTGYNHFARCAYWSFYEKVFYQSQPLYKQEYSDLSTRMALAAGNDFFKKTIRAFIKWHMHGKSSEIEEFIKANTYIEYW